MTLAVEVNQGECDAQGASGFYVEEQRRIVLAPSNHRDKKREVLVHESLHACIDASGLVFEDEEMEELIVHNLTGPLLDMLRRNPQYVAFLLDKE